MGNKGSVTIFCCLMIIAMMLLGISSLKVVEHHLAESKGAVAVKSAMSSVDAGYNSYIFENYHILLFDKNCDGSGEAYLEEQLLQDIGHNLGSGFVAEEVAVSDYELLIEEDCQAFKKQIVDYCGYAMLEYGAENILQSTGGKDGTIADNIYQDMEAAEDSTFECDEDMWELEDEEENQESEEEDPRDFTEDLTPDGILALVVPEDLDISNQMVDLSSVPSVENKFFSWDNYQIDTDFEDIDVLEENIGVFDSWKDSLIEGGAGIAYASSVFNSATESFQEDTVFDFELEYLVCGKSSDRENLKGVVNRILGIRFPVNYSYLVTDVGKMAEIKKISLPLAIATLVPEPIVRYLIAGCWSYVESIFDVRCLLDGQKMDFFKSKATWKTDLNDLGNSLNLEGQESESGLCYKDYLLILLAMDMEHGYYRMLDVIELNTRQYYEEFDINNATVGFTLDAHITYQNKDYYYRETIGY